MAKAYSRIGLSRPEQMHGDSLRQETEAVQKWPAENGDVINSKINDLGVSGYRGANCINGTHGRFLDLLHAGRAKDGSLLIVESLDRTSRRDLFEIMPAFLGIIRAGVSIITLHKQQEFRPWS